MSSKFAKTWEKPQTPSLKDKLQESIHPSGPLKARLELASRQIQSQVARLETTSTKLREKDAKIFDKVVRAISNHESDYANVYASELAEVRRLSRIVLQAKVALEQISLRLTTVSDLGDVVVTLAPAMSIVRKLRETFTKVVPQASSALGEIANTLGGILADVGLLGQYSIPFEVANEEAEKILAEASTVAERMMKQKFPELPSPTPSEASPAEFT